MRVRCGHFLTFFGAAFADVRTLLAMFNVVLAAFFAADMAGFGAKPANLRRELRVGAHEQGRRAAKCGAITVQFDTARHHFHVVFAQAGTGAMRAFVGAVVTGFDAFNIFFVWHTFLPFQVEFPFTSKNFISLLRSSNGVKILIRYRISPLGKSSFT